MLFRRQDCQNLAEETLTCYAMSCYRYPVQLRRLSIDASTRSYVPILPLTSGNFPNKRTVQCVARNLFPILPRRIQAEMGGRYAHPCTCLTHACSAATETRGGCQLEISSTRTVSVYTCAWGKTTAASPAMNRRWLLSIEPWQQYAHSQHEPCVFSIHLIQVCIQLQT